MKSNKPKPTDIENQINDEENDLMLLFKNMINAFVLFRSVFDENGKFVSYRFVYINDAYEKITGVKNNEVKGKTVHEVWPETEPEWIEKCGNVAMTGKPDSFKLFHKPTNNYYFCNVYRPFESNEKFCVIFDVITGEKDNKLSLEHKIEEYTALNEEYKAQNEELQKAKTQAEENKEKYKLLFERDHDALFIYDPKTTNIIEANKTTSQMYGFSMDELVGMSILKLSAELEQTKEAIKMVLLRI
jgi:PAS domain S-box-containing protein